MALTPVSGLRFVGRFQVTLVSFLQSFDVTTQTTNPESIAFNNDGAKMFISEDGTSSVLEYSLTTAFDVSTASFSGSSFDVSGQTTAPDSVTFNTDGAKMFIVGGSDVFEYSLTTGFDVSTASFSGSSFDVSGQETIPQGTAFNSDGTLMFICGRGSDSVFEYSLTTGFDVSTASFSGSSFDVSGQTTNPQSIAFNNDGAKMFIVGTDNVFEYSLTTAFDVSTASFSGSSFDVSGQDSAPISVAFGAGGGVMFVIGNNSDTVLQYIVGGVVPE